MIALLIIIWMSRLIVDSYLSKLDLDPTNKCICAWATTASYRPRRWIETGTFENRVAKSG